MVQHFVRALFLILVCSLCSAQTRQFEISGHYAALSGSFEHSHGLGVQASYDFGHRLGVETGITFYPADNHQFTLGQGKLIDFSAGVRLAVLRTRKIGIFAKARPGLLRLSDLRVDFPASPGFPPEFPPTPAITLREGTQTNFALDYGGTVEFYPTRRTFIRTDFGDEYVRYGAFNKVLQLVDPPITFGVLIPEHGQHQYKMTFGAGWRFGSAKEDRFGNKVADEERRWSIGTQYSTLYIDGWRSGVGAQVSRKITKLVDWGAVANVYPGDVGPDSFLWYGQRIVQFQTGPAVQLVGGKVISLKAHIRPGLLNYGDYRVFSLNGPVSAGSQTEFDLNYGIAAEFNLWKRVPLKLEVSDNLIKHSDLNGQLPPQLATWDHAPQVSVGIGFRF